MLTYLITEGLAQVLSAMFYRHILLIRYGPVSVSTRADIRHRTGYAR
jgi:hypothetical protein